LAEAPNEKEHDKKADVRITEEIQLKNIPSKDEIKDRSETVGGEVVDAIDNPVVIHFKSICLHVVY